MAASIDHAGIVPIYGAGESDGRLYIAMRYVQGTDLGSLLRRERAMAPERAVALVAQLGHALDAAHARGLAHRDVKPGNALIALEGAEEHVYLADFGLTEHIAATGGATAGDRLDKRLTDQAAALQLTNAKVTSFVSRRVRNFQYSELSRSVLYDQLWVR